MVARKDSWVAVGGDVTPPDASAHWTLGNNTGEQRKGGLVSGALVCTDGFSLGTIPVRRVIQLHHTPSYPLWVHAGSCQPSGTSDIVAGPESEAQPGYRGFC